MRKQTVISFETMPKNLPFSKRVILGVLDISGIQKYIFSDVTAKTKSNDVKRRSLFIKRLSEKIFQELQKNYGKNLIFSNVSSGKLYCAFSPKTDIDGINNFCGLLQKKIYSSTSGRLSVFFAFAETIVITPKKYDNRRMALATSILAKKLSLEKLRPDRLFKINTKEYFDIGFTEEALVSDVESSKECSSDCVAIKLDLDNLGAFFNSITSFDVKNNVSIAFDNTISRVLDSDNRITVIFSGGDDIFFLCDYGCHYDVLSTFYNNLLSEISKNSHLKRYLEEGLFGISAGACRVRGEFGTVPLIYYSESAEKMLETAKTQMGKNCLCLDGKRLSWEQLLAFNSVLSSHFDRLFPDTKTYKSVIKNPYLLRDRILKTNAASHLLGAANKELAIIEKYEV